MEARPRLCKARGGSAVALLLREVREKGLEYVELTTDPDNLASQRAILAMAEYWWNVF